MKLNQYDIWLTNLEPHFGSEQGGKRPVLLIETNAVSEKASTIVVVPLSSRTERRFSFDAIISPSKENGLDVESKALFRQIRVIDKKRLRNRIGTLEKKYWPDIKRRLNLLFDLEGDFC